MTHLLDAAIDYTVNDQRNRRLGQADDDAPLYFIASTAAHTGYEGREWALIRCATVCAAWLKTLGVEDPWDAMRAEYDRAKAKHGDRTLDSDVPSDADRYHALLEEVGEVARAVTYDREHAGDLVHEVTQVGGLALAWLAYKLRKEDSQ